MIDYDYKDDAIAYELEETARPDEMAMIQAVTDMALRYVREGKGRRIIDFCSGTGLPLIGIADDPDVDEILCVDISPEYQAFARKRFSAAPRVKFALCDAVTGHLPVNTCDIAIMASAYHHIEDERKCAFLRRVRDFIGSTGVAVVGENILPSYDYGDSESYARAVRLFYEEVLVTAEKTKPLPTDVRGLIERVAKYGFDGDYEYKTDLSLFRAHVAAAGLKLTFASKVWPTQGPLCMTTGGNYVFVLKSV